MKSMTIDAEQSDAMVRRVAREFCADCPMPVGENLWPAPGVHPLLAAKYDAVSDGLFRPCGCDFAFRFRGGRLVEVLRAVPPDFGGADVIEIAPSSPARA
jgi:hypothetical protein